MDLFLIEDDDLLNKRNDVQDKVGNKMGKELDSESA